MIPPSPPPCKKCSMKMCKKANKMDTKSDGMKPLILSMGVCDETEYKIANINFTLHVVRAQRERSFIRVKSIKYQVDLLLDTSLATPYQSSMEVRQVGFSSTSSDCLRATAIQTSGPVENHRSIPRLTRLAQVPTATAQSVRPQEPTCRTNFTCRTSMLDW